MSLSHEDLVKLAERWLMKTKKCGFVLTELVTWADEIPDAIGFRQDESYLVECKASRADYLTDQKKRFRISPEMGMGTFRYYLCLAGIIKPEDLPPRWGLLHVGPGGKVRQVVGATGHWGAQRAEFMFLERNKDSELRILYSALRRLQLRGVLHLIYEKPWEKEENTDGSERITEEAGGLAVGEIPA